MGAFWMLDADLGARFLATSAEARLVFPGEWLQDVVGQDTLPLPRSPHGSSSAQEVSAFHPCLSFPPFKSISVQGRVWGESAACVLPPGGQIDTLSPPHGHVTCPGMASAAAAPMHVLWGTGQLRARGQQCLARCHHQPRDQRTARVGSDCPLCWLPGGGRKKRCWMWRKARGR